VATFLCIGGALIDRKYELHAPLLYGTSNPGRVVSSHGGVARNICENLARLGAEVSLAAAVGADEAGRAIIAALAACGADISRMIVMEGEATAEYAAILQAGSRDLALAVVAMDHAEARIAQEIGAVLSGITAGMTVFADANLPRKAMRKVIEEAARIGFTLIVDAVSASKAMRLPEDLSGVSLLFMNADEAAAITGEEASRPSGERFLPALANRGARRVVITSGANGLIFADGWQTGHIPALKVRNVDVTGAGDSLIGTTLWRLSLGDSLKEALGWGVLCAGLTVESGHSVLPQLSPGFLEANRWRIAA
jgi:pseudouridine kinase